MLQGNSVRKAIAVACLLGSGGAAFAQKASLDLQELAAAARFVVHSRVSKVEYRMSEAGGKGQQALPYTLVTYDVVRAVSGSPGSSSFTLRYVGGPDGRGRFMSASNVPIFQLGDEDILFVRENGSSSCALVGCVEGRFRVLRGQVYEGTGTPVKAIDGHRVVAGGEQAPEFGKLSFPAPAFEELLKNPEVRQRIRQQGMSVEEARRRYQAEAPATIEMGIISGGRASDDAAGFGAGQVATDAERLAGSGSPMPTDRFLAALAGVRVAEAGTGVTFQSADPQMRINAPSMRAAPPSTVSESITAPKRSAADLAEERSLPKDDPTITRRKVQ